MAKRNSKVEVSAPESVTAPAAAPAAPAAAPAAPAKVSGILAVKVGQKYRGARQAWYEVLCSYDGKPVAEFLAHVTETRPSNYGARSKHAGKPEPVNGWLGFFKRTGVATIL